MVLLLALVTSIDNQLCGFLWCSIWVSDRERAEELLASGAYLHAHVLGRRRVEVDSLC